MKIPLNTMARVSGFGVGACRATVSRELLGTPLVVLINDGYIVGILEAETGRSVEDYFCLQCYEVVRDYVSQTATQAAAELLEEEMDSPYEEEHEEDEE